METDTKTEEVLLNPPKQSSGTKLWKKGTSGNKRGRPKGSKNSVTILKEAIVQGAEDIMVKEFPKVVKAVVKKAQEGDMTAAKMIMDRIIPTKRSVEVTGKDGSDLGIKIIVQQLQQEAEKAPEKIIDGTIEDTQ